VQLRYGESVRRKSLDFAGEMAEFGANSIYFRTELQIKDQIVSRQTVFLTAPRYLKLERKKIAVQVKKTGERRFELIFLSRGFHHAVQFSVPGISHRAEDNFFDLYPNEPRSVALTTHDAVSAADLRQVLETVSLVDSYR
jgi:beta-mannosidase